MMDAAQPVVIVNPRSGGGLSTARWAKLVGPLTEGPGDGRRLSREEARRGRSVVVALGGDGTISEVADGILEAGNGAALGIIPRGTGGDFCRLLEVPKEIREAGRRIREGSLRAIDAGRVTFAAHGGATETRHFVNVASFGFSSDVALRANRSSKRLGAKMAFLGATVRSLISYDNAEVFISVDGGPRQRLTILLGAVGNGRFFGGGMKICPDAGLTDGLLDLVTVGDLGRFDVLTKISRIYAGTHVTTMPEVQSARAHTIEVTPVDKAATIPLEIDGETPGHLPALFEIRPGALRLRL
jgi:diacylglycerol kinase (ATP)